MAGVSLQVTWDTPLRIPTVEDRSAWFPDLVVDHDHRVHVVWCSTDHAEMRRGARGERRRKLEELQYARLEAQRWSPATSIALSQQSILRNAIAVDAHDVLHLLFDFSPGGGHDLYYRQAPAQEGFADHNWREPERLNARWNTYMSDVATWGDAVHVVYDDAGAVDAACAGCADIYYRRSRDRGSTWSEAVSLRPSPVGAARPQIRADAAGTLYVAWDEGWDRWSGRGRAREGVFIASADGGERWSEPLVVSYPNAENVQLAVGATGRGGVLLVWRTTSDEDPSIYYLWSTDWGAHWSEPAPLPGLIARPWGSPFDLYTMETDVAGNIHLLATGLLATSGTAAVPEPHRLFHVAWDGQRWTTPLAVYEGEGYPEYPQLVVASGTELYATFFTRASAFGEERPHQIWYAHGVVSPAAPAQIEPPVAARLIATYAPILASQVPGLEPPQQDPAPRRVKWTELLLLAASLVAGTVIVAVIQLFARVTARLRPKGAPPPGSSR